MHILAGTDGSPPAIAAAIRARHLFAAAETLTLLTASAEPPEAIQGLESGFAGGIALPEEVEAGFKRVDAEMRAALAATTAALEGAAQPSVIHEIVEFGFPGKPSAEWRAN